MVVKCLSLFACLLLYDCLFQIPRVPQQQMHHLPSGQKLTPAEEAALIPLGSPSVGSESAYDDDEMDRQQVGYLLCYEWQLVEVIRDLWHFILRSFNCTTDNGAVIHVAVELERQ